MDVFIRKDRQAKSFEKPSFIVCLMLIAPEGIKIILSLKKVNNGNDRES